MYSKRTISQNTFNVISLLLLLLQHFQPVSFSFKPSPSWTFEFHHIGTVLTPTEIQVCQNSLITFVQHVTRTLFFYGRNTFNCSNSVIGKVLFLISIHLIQLKQIKGILLLYKLINNNKAVRLFTILAFIYVNLAKCFLKCVIIQGEWLWYSG